MGYSKRLQCTMVLTVLMSIGESQKCGVAAFVPASRSVLFSAIATAADIGECTRSSGRGGAAASRRRRQIMHNAVRDRATARRSAVADVIGSSEEVDMALKEIASRPPRSGLKKVIISKGKARLFWDGNPTMVYGGAVGRVEGDPTAGEVVDVVDPEGKFIAWGVYNPDSMYRVRILAKEGEALADYRDVGAVVRERLRTARDARRAIGIPSEQTDTYRLVNGEGDRLSGLVIDVFARVVGVSSSAIWVETYRSEIEVTLREEFGADADEIVWRRSDGRLQQDGWKGLSVAATGTDSGAKQCTAISNVPGDSKLDAEELDSVSDVVRGGAAAGENDDNNNNGERISAAEQRDGGERTEGGRLWDTLPATIVRELGLEYEVRPQFGQKTGFYCDQRESREAVRNFSRGKSVLDMFCYSGGFALNAATGGATRVVGVDSSQPAVEAARKNAARNNLEKLTEFVKDDALNFMKRAKDNEDKYDLVVLDPPKLAPNKKALARATSRYRRLNQAALELIAPGGLLVTFTCSAAMTQSGNFVGVVQSAAAAAGRTVTLLKTVGPAADHVLNPCYPEGSYLTGAFFYVV